ncbi:MAG: YaaR family protein [Spirochaetes bacterium]|nr:YaaR family protein [Spirochaetota bacterium]
MERIDSATGSSNLRSEKGKKAGKKAGSFLSGIFSAAQAPDSITETDFSFYLSQAVDENVSLETLLDDVHSVGEKLVEKPFIANIKEYKQAVRRFLAYVVKNTYSAESEIEKKKYVKNGLPYLDEKKWMNIKVVDEKLEKLALYIMQNQKGQLTILKKIEEIEGILVDLMR